MEAIDGEARRAKRSFVMVKLTHRRAEPVVTVGRIINCIPVIKRIWGLGSMSEELYEIHVSISVN